MESKENFIAYFLIIIIKSKGTHKITFGQLQLLK